MQGCETAFSTTVGQDLPAAARDAEQARAISKEIGTIGFGVVLIIVGIWLVFSKPRSRATAGPTRRESRKQ
jgi:Na+-driven multidrug efflux pump